MPLPLLYILYYLLLK